ncbi:3-oxoacyl-[acyl-carrier-protein] synthase III C-terminal domain-containing protein [Sphingomonas sp. JC676]|uniref:3-oxoacyl-[acyl-carrier-protein] synthase III C-terminal domain-containing protein n=1 Tax=Sphingomonas sp. JC676 TaxID=2768065 RepID=UPI001CA7052D|nr:3-oxoacyl-[acyl-carrier-protein] synthase III C-terminal domain-containing protein [Sphingomonas sp. JC676]
MQPVYVTATAQCLPGAPVGNEAMVEYIGRLSPEAERLGRLTLRQNRIRGRHYAIRPDGSSDWTVAKLAGRAVRGVLAQTDPQRVGFLATATTQNDLLVPGLASGVHAESGLPPIEVASLQSVCASSMMAFKTAALQVAAGEHRAAIVAGAEFSSRYFRPGHYIGTDTMRADGTLPGDAEFLRWTLSDGAAALLIEDRPAERGLSLRVDWISLRSFADRFAPCMTGGAVRGADGDLTPWSLTGGAPEAARAGAFQLRQDIDALYRMLPVWMGEFMRLVDDGKIDPDAVDWFLCHFSAHSLREEMVKLATRAGCMIPEERWFTNIYDKGNVGAAAIFLMIDDLMCSGRLRPGQRILCAVPESGQCIMAYAGLTVVGDEK